VRREDIARAATDSPRRKMTSAPRGTAHNSSTPTAAATGSAGHAQTVNETEKAQQEVTRTPDPTYRSCSAPRNGFSPCHTFCCLVVLRVACL